MASKTSELNVSESRTRSGKIFQVSAVSMVFSLVLFFLLLFNFKPFLVPSSE